MQYQPTYHTTKPRRYGTAKATIARAIAQCGGPKSVAERIGRKLSVTHAYADPDHGRRRLSTRFASWLRTAPRLRSSTFATLRAVFFSRARRQMKLCISLPQRASASMPSGFRGPLTHRPTAADGRRVAPAS